MRQKHDAKMVWVGPVKARALHQHDPRLTQQLQEKLAVVLDWVHHRIQFGEHVQRSHRLDAGHARNGGDQLISQVPLATQPAAFTGQIVDALVAAERGLNGPLARHVGAQLHVAEHVQAFDVVNSHRLVARHHQPASTVAAAAVAFAQ